MGRPANTLAKMAQLHEASTDERKRSTVRAAARKLAVRLGVESPPWAGAPRQVVTLEALEARHRGQTGRQAAATREHARKLATKHRVLVPSWAAPLGKARKLPAPRLAPAPATRPEPLDLPEALLAWRRGRNGRGITRHADDGAVTLTESTGIGQWIEATFPSVAAAAAAVVPAIPWKRKERAATWAGRAVSPAARSAGQAKSASSRRHDRAFAAEEESATA